MCWILCAIQTVTELPHRTQQWVTIKHSAQQLHAYRRSGALWVKYGLFSPSTHAYVSHRAIWDIVCYLKGILNLQTYQMCKLESQIRVLEWFLKDAEDWTYGAGNLALPSHVLIVLNTFKENKLFLIAVISHNKHCCISDQINAALVSRDFLFYHLPEKKQVLLPRKVIAHIGNRIIN